MLDLHYSTAIPLFITDFNVNFSAERERRGWKKRKKTNSDLVFEHVGVNVRPKILKWDAEAWRCFQCPVAAAEQGGCSPPDS